MIKSKKRLDTALILFFSVFILSFVAIGTTIENIKILSDSFNWKKIFHTLIWMFIYVIIWRFIFIYNTKIFIDKEIIIIKNFFKTKKFRIESIDYIILGNEFAKFISYDVFYIIKDQKVIQRISSFDYSNYNELENAFKNKISTKELSSFEQLKYILGFSIKIK